MSTSTQHTNDTNSNSRHDNDEISVHLCEDNVGRHASHTDLIIATLPKSGTIWLKALAFAIINRSHYPSSSSSSENYHQHPLLTISPRDLVPFVDFKQLYPDNRLLDFTKNSTNHDSPCRLIATHVPYPSLPESIKITATNCKIVYLCRNPQDNFSSLWLFMNKARAMPMLNNNNASLSMDEAFDYFCDGVQEFGPYWDHVLGYWKESIKNPDKVLFDKYENLKKEPKTQTKRIAEFTGCGFSSEEENQGVVEDISSLCSFENLKNLDVNKNGTWRGTIQNKEFFRKGEVGDWKNYLTPIMIKTLDGLMKEKLHGSGLVFQNYLP
ncbi:hypothetical protein MKW98_010424 [Papaver atlanticum]|uniref:Sulfotransferase n=1 Tax=Papaver atlanticum TaxID=357466 RepID=A0AAD4TAJ8_9MAGN|nr:hypothetical protein MKW98_010424 [Papaver atlanticum]